MLSDDERALLEERARKAVDVRWSWAVALSQDVDFDVAKARRRELEAKAKGNASMHYFWGLVGTSLYHRQKENDEAICERIEELDNLNDLWPDDYSQSLDLNFGLD